MARREENLGSEIFVSQICLHAFTKHTTPEENSLLLNDLQELKFLNPYMKARDVLALLPQYVFTCVHNNSKHFHRFHSDLAHAYIWVRRETPF